MAVSATKTVGVLGGMGPDATVDFMSAVIALTDASTDQDHIPMVIDHNPRVPDRQAALSGDRTTVSEVLSEMALRLQGAGADFLVMPCNTASVFADAAVAAVDIPFLNIIDETVAAIDPAVSNVGVLATDACLVAGPYQAAIENSGRAFTVPESGDQEKLMDLIFSIKSGEKGDSIRDAMSRLAIDLVDAGAQAIIAGCTEIPIVISQADIAVPFYSSTHILAQRTVDIATGQNNNEDS